MMVMATGILRNSGGGFDCGGHADFLRSLQFGCSCTDLLVRFKSVGLQRARQVAVKVCKQKSHEPAGVQAYTGTDTIALQVT